MNPHQPTPARSPRHFASALVLWLVALFSVAVGGQPAVPLDLAQASQGSANATKAGELPVQRSTGAGVETRVAALWERTPEGLTVPGFDGPDAAIDPHHGLDVPAHRSATGDPVPTSFVLTARASGFRARAPPILA